MLFTDPNVNPKQAAMEKLGEDIAELSAHLQAADYQLLCLIREFDAEGGWAFQGATSCAHWLSWRIGLDLGAAREKVRVARALAELPLIAEAMRKGEISYSKVRAVTRVAKPESEQGLLTIALGGTASQVERIVRAWRKVDAPEERKLAKDQQRERSLHWYYDDEGMLVLKARLTPEAGAVVKKALEAAGEALYRKEKEPDAASPTDVSILQRRADALKLLAESALSGSLDPGNSGDHYLVVVHVDQPVLENPESPGQSVLDGGVRVSAETSRRVACDSSMVDMTHDPEGNILDVGRKTRTIPPAIRRALDARDPTCRFPGCSVTFKQGHHVEHWANGGETKLSNLMNLCSPHHHLVHDGGYRAELLPNGEAKFHDPWGRLIPAIPPPAPVPENPLEKLRERNEREGIAITGEEGQPKWGYFPVNLADAVDGIINDVRRYHEGNL